MIMKKMIVFLLTGCIFLLNADEIGIIYNQSKKYSPMIEKFNKIMKDKGITVTQVPYEKDELVLSEIIKKSSADYFFSIGTLSTMALKKSGRIGLFTMVFNPFELGLIDQNGVPSSNVTGVLVNISPQYKMEALKNILKHKRLGIIYNPKISSFLVSKTKSVADRLGFSIYEIKVNDKSEVASSLKLLRKNADCIYSIIDSTVYNSFNFKIILKYSILYKKPFIGFAENQAKAGALISFYFDYQKLGESCARSMIKLINDENSLNQPLEMIKEGDFVISKKICDIMKVKIPDRYKNKLL